MPRVLDLVVNFTKSLQSRVVRSNSDLTALGTGSIGSTGIEGEALV